MQKTQFLEEITDDLKAQKTFRFSAAWRPKGSAALVVPVISRRQKARRYVTIQEAKRVEVLDTGGIGAVRIMNNEDLPVFVRVGSLLQGKGTQSRAVNKSLIIAPSDSIDVGVNCVHHSHYIDSTASFRAEASHLAPASVERHLVAGGQGAVWNAVSRYTACKAQVSGRANTDTADNLVGEMNVKDRFTEMVDRLAEEVPNHEGQVGLAVFDERGVYGVEAFDSPASWLVFNKAVVEKFGDLLVRKVDEGVLDVRVREGKVMDGIAKFLDTLKAGQTEVVSLGLSQTVNVVGPVCGEAVFLEGEFVHLTAVSGEEGGDEVGPQPQQGGPGGSIRRICGRRGGPRPPS